MKPVLLLPLGSPDRGLVEELAAALGDTLRIPVETSHAAVDLQPFYDPARGQYNSTRILAWMRGAAPALTRRPLPGAVLLGVVPHDLFIPILTFVFGEAELNGAVAVISTHRLDNRRYGLPPDPARFSERVRKEALHELGHTFGLVHCQSQECVMRSSSSVEDIDLKGAAFCAECRVEAGLHLPDP